MFSPREPSLFDFIRLPCPLPCSTSIFVRKGRLHPFSISKSPGGPAQNHQPLGRQGNPCISEFFFNPTHPFHSSQVFPCVHPMETVQRYRPGLSGKDELSPQLPCVGRHEFTFFASKDVPMMLRSRRLAPHQAGSPGTRIDQF